MANAHYIYAMKGMDSSANKILLPRDYTSFAVNMSFRSNEASSRPPFVNMTNEFPYKEGNEEEVFGNGNVTGVFGYAATIPTTQSYIIAAIGDSIFAGLVSGITIQWRRIYKGIDPKWQMSFFCQANQYLIWQNGKDLPLYWDGISTTMKYCKDAPGVENQMPIGNVMVFAHGRVFVATEDNLVYASNFAYSTGLDGYGVFNFTESQYFSGGDGFGAPASLGRITGGGVIQRTPDANGHGPVVFFQERGAFAIDASKSRDNWTNDPNIQQIVLTGRGCSSPFSVVAANGDLWYRCNDKTISSFKRELSQQGQWNNKSLSKEVTLFTNYDAETTLLFSFGLFIDNRLLMSVGSRNEIPENNEYGYHRYCLGMVSLDFDSGSTVLSDEPFTWDGLWTGPRVTGATEIIVAGEQRGFVFSFDTDRKNRVYWLAAGIKNDATVNGEKEIVCAFKNEGLFFDPGKTNIFSSTKVKFANAIGGIKIKQYFSTEDYQYLEELPYKEREGRFCQSQANDTDCLAESTSAALSGSVTFKAGCSRHRIGTTQSTTKGEWFSLLTEFQGAMTIRYIQAYSDESIVDKMDLEPKKITEPIYYCGFAQDALNYSFP